MPVAVELRTHKSSLKRWRGRVLSPDNTCGVGCDRDLSLGGTETLQMVQRHFVLGRTETLHWAGQRLFVGQDRDLSLGGTET